MIKPPNSNAEFIKSDRKSQLIDLFPTILRSVDINYSDCEVEGFPLFHEGFPKSRPANFFYWWPPNERNPEIIRMNILNQNRLHVSQVVNEGFISQESISVLPKCGIPFNIGSHDEGSLGVEGLSDKEFHGEEGVSAKPTNWRWASRGNSRFVFQKLRLRSARPLRVNFTVMPFEVNINREMTLQTSLSKKIISLKEGWNRYSVILDFPSDEILSFEALYEKSGSPIQLGINKDERDLSVAWNKIILENVK